MDETIQVRLLFKGSEPAPQTFLYLFDQEVFPLNLIDPANKNESVNIETSISREC